MASLNDLIQKKYDFDLAGSDRLEKGNILMMVVGTEYTDLCNHLAWCAPSKGCVTIEAWGSGGSTAKMCCCGYGLPGNPGAYARKYLRVDEGDIICARPGRSCNNANDLCFRGCSEPSWAYWRLNNGDCYGCLCAQGGIGGISYCSTSTSAVCCYGANGFAVTVANSQCGIVCNYRASVGASIAQAYGGNVNIPGGVSKMEFWCYHPNRPCAYIWCVAGPAGFFGTCGSYINFPAEQESTHSNFSGQGLAQYLYGLSAAATNPTSGTIDSRCWTGGRTCGCYDSQGCANFIPVGFPGPSVSPCAGVRDHGWRGGMGGIRIKFVEDKPCHGMFKQRFDSCNASV